MSLHPKKRENQILHKMRIIQTRVFGFLMLPLIAVNDTTTHAGFGKTTMLWLGIFCLLVCAFGRATSSLYIGGRKNEEIVRYGVFSIVRNPLYVFSFFGVLGIGLICNSLIITALLAAIFIAYYQMIVAKEEKFLTLKFGQTYTDYTKQVPRWIPNLQLWKTPEIIETKPVFVLRTMRDAANFFICIPIAQTIAWLQLHHIVPVFFHLP